MSLQSKAQTKRAEPSISVNKLATLSGPNALSELRTVKHIGRVVQAYGTSLRVTGIRARVGQRCKVTDKRTRQTLYADVVGLANGEAILYPLGSLSGVAVDSEVTLEEEQAYVKVSDSLRGKVLDALGSPLDGSQLDDGIGYPLQADSPNPLTRELISQPFQTGVKIIDSLLTVGVGQRMGIFSMAGGGKSTLLAMLAKNSEADVVVVGLIGERGREVREFIDHSLGADGLARSVLVVATSDRPAMERVKAAQTATAIAEGFRDQGKRVLLLMDSVTRYARAMREIGLSIGEPAVRRGFPPSVFAELPKLFERTGNNETGSITAFYTVLSEDEDSSDPIAEETRSILDGHIVLTRKLGEKGQYPAIDPLMSVSRVFPHITSEVHQAAALKTKQLISRYQDLEILLQLGEYKEGVDALADEAVQKQTSINEFFKQTPDEFVGMEETTLKLEMLAK
ncbi:MAG: FliI/YscN family ATPase [Granulosicoccaceae bacterium]